MLSCHVQKTILFYQVFIKNNLLITDVHSLLSFISNQLLLLLFVFIHSYPLFQISDVIGAMTTLNNLIPSKTNQEPRRQSYLKDVTKV
jgi:hypothetical protein